MISDTYITIAQASEGVYKEKGSRFLAIAVPVASEDDIKEHLNRIKNEYYDARHHCYAWVLGKDAENFRANDDGEPNHSAGDPILNTIRSFQYSDILVVVVRYFGGIKLGVGGLITAYKEASKDALIKAESKEVILKSHIEFEFNYEAMNEIMRIVKDLDLDVVQQDFQLVCKLECKIRLGQIEQLEKRLEYIPGLLNYHLRQA
jgi:uncharacterized YigZ family protein